MIRIDASSPVPIYDQIKSGLKGLVAKGILKPGDAAPSIRELSAKLKVNPNTVARAFRELSVEGFFDSRRGEGSFISEGALRRVRSGLGESSSALADSLRLARRSGLGWQDIEEVVREIRKEEP